MPVSPEDIRALIQDKYDGNEHADIADDLKRLESGEPLAYVIGWLPFLGVRIDLSSRPLVPRPETEHWTEALITHLKDRFNGMPFTLLDLCAGSGAIGLAVLKALPNAHVTFAELEEKHTDGIRRSAADADIDSGRFEIRTGDLFAAVGDSTFDVIATNPPYIPSARDLPHSVIGYEPREALYSGEDGMLLIRRILSEAPAHLHQGGELWLECDISHSDEVLLLAKASGTLQATINLDQYGRPRTLVSYYP